MDGNDYGNENYGKLPLELIEYSEALVIRISGLFEYTKALQIGNRLVMDSGISVRIRMCGELIEEFRDKMCAYYDILYPEANGGLLIDVEHVFSGSFIDRSVKFLCKLGLGHNGEYGEIKRDLIPNELYEMPLYICLDEGLGIEDGMVMNTKVNWDKISDEMVRSESMGRWYSIVN
jgi:hypothetical protein